MFFADATRTLFGARFMVSMVVAGRDDVLGSSDLAREWYELKEKCETIEQGNSKAEQELVEL